tara:strand:+ start:244 stop:879 length:636 start_codon:yes stop_codon:yes gene_type:complete
MGPKVAGAVKLEAVDLKTTFKMGAVESMYGGSGYKAKVLPYMEIVLPAQRVPWKIEAKSWQGQGDPTAKAAVTVTDDGVMALLQKVDKVGRAALTSHISEFFPDQRKRPEKISSVFNPTVQEAGEYDPVFKARLKVVEGRIVTPLFHMETKELLDANVQLEKGALVTLVVAPLHVYAMKGGCGVTWNVVRMGLVGFAGEEEAKYDFGSQAE